MRTCTHFFCVHRAWPHLCKQAACVPLSKAYKFPFFPFYLLDFVYSLFLLPRSTVHLSKVFIWACFISIEGFSEVHRNFSPRFDFCIGLVVTLALEVVKTLDLPGLFSLLRSQTIRKIHLCEKPTVVLSLCGISRRLVC